MNGLKERTITITYWVWEPNEQVVRKEEDELGQQLKEKKLLHHAGYVKCMYGGVK
jgi:hypothetical protein